MSRPILFFSDLDKTLVGGDEAGLGEWCTYWQEEERAKLRALASETAKRQAKARALQQAAAAAKQQEEREKLRGLAQGAARKQRGTALQRGTLRAARDGADGAIEKLREAWLRGQSGEEDGEVDVD